jgi:hypothetical protein
MILTVCPYFLFFFCVRIYDAIYKLYKLNPTSYFSKHISCPPNESTIGCIYDQLAFAIMIYISARYIIH